MNIPDEKFKETRKALLLGLQMGECLEKVLAFVESKGLDKELINFLLEKKDVHYMNFLKQKT